MNGVMRTGHQRAASRRRVPIRCVVRAVLVVVALVAVAVVGVRLASARGVEFEVRDMKTGEVVYTRAVDVGESFTLEHTHSVTKRLVVETFSVGDEPTILLDELWFDEFGPNLPAGPEQIGERTTTFLHENGAYRVLHHSHPIDVVAIRAGSEAVDHVVTFADGDRLRLLDVVRPGEHVELAVRER